MLKNSTKTVNNIKTGPREVFCEYKDGKTYQNGIGMGLQEQSTRNELFYVGDQWNGVQCGNDKPLVRRNIIKRIGEYKLASVGSAPIAVNYSADGVPNTEDIKNEGSNILQEMMAGEMPGKTSAPEISFVMGALSEYFKTTAERVKFNLKKDELLKDAYITGTAIAYTYWDSDIKTGLYADECQQTPITGDLQFEVVDVNNVVFGDPNCADVQSQPFIIIAQRRTVSDVKREARRNGLSDEDITPDREDRYYTRNTGRGEAEPNDSRRVTVLTKFYKEYLSDEHTYKVMAVRVTEKAIVRKVWDVGISLYPMAKFCWERRKNCAYGDSEITYLIPNQIAINRALTASVWATMSAGMPKLIVNNDILIDTEISNEPGEIIKVAGADELRNAMYYLQPPAWGSGFSNFVNDLANSTLSDSGANDAALGNQRPDNAAAIIQLREAALAPMQVYQNRFYEFVEDIARIWADFWLNLYGKRSLKINDKTGTYYLPFDGQRYRNLVITAKIDVGSSMLWSEAVIISTLGNLLQLQLITFEEYLERLPKGIIPNITGLIESRKQQAAAAAQTPPYNGGDIGDEEILQILKQQYPEEFAKLQQLPPGQQQMLLQQLRVQNTGAEVPTERMSEI